ncbi:MAG: hypothetical protein ACTSVA_01155 [Candidatus Njordarchaeales archaeon]
MSVETTTIRVRRETRDKLRELAKKSNTTISNVVALLLERGEIAERLDMIIELLRERNELLKELIRIFKSREGEGGQVKAIREEVSTSSEEEPELPSFVRDNPWLEILRGINKKEG